ncbi:hypothetical protein IMG5_108850 [Ichthyophthirius multifiliis]|uniref:STOP protein n=1 Tax=Ichthyophthirius multifiliis TaxID=5932 RepID=G0QTI7_ICHMU|nr:hypothetical protein IMG5_108850 [Ichthyophthirius multifiliis]EGR31472.1 hypothetical protein IMG5_108850 [Ichthyophthirius multifiliis]|eukprot:XP_004034958.1 hypothetical protein IMG5_108850 [Ichthyophthirius multifiliis]
MKTLQHPQIQYETPIKSQQKQPKQKRISVAGHHYGHDNQCVCQICTCKKHYCPPKGPDYAPGILKSTMKNDYEKYNLNPEDPTKRSSKKQYYQTNYDPEILKTTNQQAYTPFNPQPVQRIAKSQNNDNQIKIPFNGESTYKSNYQKANTNLYSNPQVSKQVNEKPHIPFNASTTYKDNFDKNASINNYNNNGPFPSQQKQTNTNINLPFNGHSTYKQEYQKYNIHPDNNENKQNMKKSQQQVPFYGQSSYKEDYKKFGMDQYKKERCLIYDYPERPRLCSPGKSHLYYHAEQDNWD